MATTGIPSIAHTVGKPARSQKVNLMAGEREGITGGDPVMRQLMNNYAKAGHTGMKHAGLKQSRGGVRQYNRADPDAAMEEFE